MEATTHALIRNAVANVPAGRVATYGDIAGDIPRCTARMVGYALAALPAEVDTPWHRVVNARGEVSRRAFGDGHAEQRRLLGAEGIRFDDRGRIDMRAHRIES